MHVAAPKEIVGVGRLLKGEGALDRDGEASLVDQPAEVGQLDRVGSDEDVAAGQLLHRRRVADRDDPAVGRQELGGEGEGVTANQIDYRAHAPWLQGADTLDQTGAVRDRLGPEVA